MSGSGDVGDTLGPASGQDSLAVSVVISRRPVPGREQELVAWAEGISAAAAEFEGHLGAQVYPPAPPERADLVIAFSFASAEHLHAWEHSAARQEWLDRGRDLAVGSMRSHPVTGFESLFSERGAPVVPPPRWKTAVLIALSVYPISLVLNWLAPSLIGSWNLFLRVLVLTVLIVPFVVWVGVPNLSKWLRGWLHPAPRDRT